MQTSSTWQVGLTAIQIKHVFNGQNRSPVQTDRGQLLISGSDLFSGVQDMDDFVAVGWDRTGIRGRTVTSLHDTC